MLSGLISDNGPSESQAARFSYDLVTFQDICTCAECPLVAPGERFPSGGAREP